LYASLYAAIGDAYGAGDGTTTFNLPNLEGRVPVGVDGSNVAFDTLGEIGGDQTHSLDGTGTATGYGLMYGESMDTADTTGTNMPPYQVVHYVIKATAGITEEDSALTDRVSTLEATVGSMFPAGTILASAITTAPDGWAVCDGSAVSRSTYASLFAAIGTTYGAGDEVTTFNLPDLQGRTIFGVDESQAEFDTLGESGGNKLIQGHGAGTATGYGLTYSESVLTTTGLTTAQNLPPYTALNYLIRLVTATPDAESEFVTRLGELETFVENGGNESPAGSIMAWASNTAPSNWLICDGSVVLKADWPSLYSAIGNQYALGGETELEFRLPNLKGRVAVGRDASQTEFDTLGEIGGAKTHTLTTAEMPSHTHTQDSHNHTQNSHTHVQDSHNHTQNAHNHNFLYQGVEYAGWNAASVAGSSLNFYVGNSAFPQTTIANRTATNNATTATNQSTTATNNATTATNQNTGGGEAHNNLQPYIVLNYIIKATSGVSTTDSVLVERVGELELQAEAPIKLNLQTISDDYIIPVGYNGLSAGPIIIADGVTVTIPDGSAWSVV
jgi:microcystin-dependent protein